MMAQLQWEQLRNGGYGAINYVCDASSIPVPDGAFDLVLCTEVLEHVPELIRVVREFARILRPGGRLPLTSPLGSGVHQEPYHFYGGYTPYWYRKFLAEVGFEQIHVEPNGGFFRFYGQESIRFLQMSSPWHLGLLAGLLWLPFWLLLLPLQGLVFPVLASWLDRYNRRRNFTLGYRVTAVCARFGKPA